MVSKCSLTLGNKTLLKNSKLWPNSVRIQNRVYTCKQNLAKLLKRKFAKWRRSSLDVPKTFMYTKSCSLHLALRTGLLIFRAVREPRRSGKSAKSRVIHKNTQNTMKFARKNIKYNCLYNIIYLKLILAIWAVYLP